MILSDGLGRPAERGTLRPTARRTFRSRTGGGMNSDNDLWVPLDEALRLVRQTNDPLLNVVGFADRTRLGGWILDGRVMLRFAESIGFEPDDGPPSPKPSPPDDATSVQPLWVSYG